MAAEFEAAVFGELAGLHHAHVKVNHVSLLGLKPFVADYCIKNTALSKIAKLDRPQASGFRLQAGIPVGIPPGL